MISLEEAKKLMTKSSKEKLKKLVDLNLPKINFSNKINNDIVMQALCRAVEDDVIHISDLDDKLVKLLNSNTNTISIGKLNRALSVIRKTNPNIICYISLKDPESHLTMNEWFIDGTDEYVFHRMFEYVLTEFKITPHIIRNKMTETLKPTVVNNVAQLVAKYSVASKEERNKMVISIRTITRLVNMSGYLIYAEFKKI